MAASLRAEVNKQRKDYFESFLFVCLFIYLYLFVQHLLLLSKIYLGINFIGSKMFSMSSSNSFESVYERPSSNGW